MKPILKFSVLLLLLLACKRDKVNYIGPNYVAAPEGFAIKSFTASATAVNFTSGKVTFDASFTHEVTWILTIKGNRSEAVCEFSGTGDTIASLDWNGQNTGEHFFRTAELAVATLSFYNSTVTDSRTITITRVEDYRTSCGSIFPRYAEFENPDRISSPNWQRFECGNMEHGVDSVAVDYNGDVVRAAQGKMYGYMRGLGEEQSFVCGIQFIGGDGNMLPTSPATRNDFPSDPEQLWFNILLYGTGDENAQVDIEMQEEDNDGIVGGYGPTDDDAFVVSVKLNYKGWKMHSFKYSDFIPAVNRRFGGNGNRVREPNKIKQFDMILLKMTNPNAPVEVYFDYMIFTIGGPFKPCK